jgi:hypothetical protein
MKPTLKEEIIDMLDEQESIYASEKLADNIVKKEFHKGALWALHYIRSYMENSTPELVSDNFMLEIALIVKDFINAPGAACVGMSDLNKRIDVVIARLQQ